MWPLDVSGGGHWWWWWWWWWWCVCVCACVMGGGVAPSSVARRAYAAFGVVLCDCFPLCDCLPSHPPQNGSLATVDTSCRTSTLANTPCGSTSSRSLQRRSRLCQIGLLDGLSSQPTSRPPCSCCLGYTPRSCTGSGRARLGSCTD